MNKKGFTLAELLGVIVIIGIISLIAFPPIINQLKKNKDKVSETTLELIYSAAEAYMDDNPNLFPMVKNDTYCITLEQIIHAGLMQAPIKDVNGKPLDITKTVKVTVLDDNGNNDKTFGDADECTIPEPLTLKYCDTTTTTECFKEDGNYIGATGTVGNNWLWYGGHLWRIMSEDKTEKSLTLITSYPTTAISWGDTVPNKPSLEQSYISTWLNEVFYASLPQTVKNNVMPMTYDRKVYNGSNIVNETKTGVNVRLLTEAEYIEAGSSTSYLNISDYYWLSDIYSASDVRSMNDLGDVYSISPSGTDGVRPVMKISSNLTISEGNGTMTSPYTVSEERSKSTSNIKVGEYVFVPKSDGTTYLTRVVKNDSNGIKVILNGLYNASSFGSNITLTNASTVYTGSLTDFKNTLNIKYYNSSNQQYNITAYPNGANWNNNTTMVSLDISLPSVGEMFSGNDIDLSTSSTKIFVDSSKILNTSLNNYYWLGNSYSTSHVRDVFYNGNMNAYSPSYTFGVRPVFMINSDMTITGGNGTANSPYTLK